jgi:hypothetical protein
LAGDWPLGYPLYLKAVQHNRTAAVVGQVVAATITWVALAVVTARAARHGAVRVATGLVVLAIGASFATIQWDPTISSDSLSISLCVGLLATAFWLRERWTWPRVILLTALALATAADRDTNGLLLGVLAVVVGVVVLVRIVDRRWLVVGGVLLTASALSLISADGGHRWQEPLQNVVSIRLLNSPERTTFLRAHGMPLSSDEIALARGRCVTPTPVLGCATVSNPRFYEWIHDHGRAVYLEMLVHYPVTTVAEPVRHLDWSLGTRVHLEAANGVDTAERSPLSHALDTVVFIMNPWALAIAAAIQLALSIVFWFSGYRGPFAIAAALIALVYVHLWLVFTGDAIEVTRHSVVASIQLRLALWLCALWLVDALLAGRRTPPDVSAPDASAPPP